MENIKDKVISGFVWRLIQNTSAQIVNFVVSIILARLLLPADYGIVAMITVFTSLAMVFVNVGFTSSVVQKENLSRDDLDTAFYSGIATAVILYGLLFLAAPLIAKFYREPQLVVMLRVYSLIILLGALYSVPQALLTRQLEFKKSMAISLTGAVTHGVVGIVLAFQGFGVWALIYSTIADQVMAVIVAWIVTKWRINLRFSLDSFRNMFSFSLQMLSMSLLDAFFNNIRSLIIGRRYSSEDLAYYNRGYQFPTIIMIQIDGAMTTVLFSSLSKYQQDWERGLSVLRRAMRMSLYVCTPLMIGLAAVAEPMILFLLTDKWYDSIEYVRLVALLCISWPLSAEKHALNARGRSDISLKLNLMSKGIILVGILATYRISVSALVISTVVTSFLAHFVSMFVYRKYLDYSLRDQIMDLLPPIALSALMGLIVYILPLAGRMSSFAELMIRTCVGVAVYIILSALFKVDSFVYLYQYLKKKLVKGKA